MGHRSSVIGPLVLRSASSKRRLTVAFECGIPNLCGAHNTECKTTLCHRGKLRATRAHLTAGIGSDTNGGRYFEVNSSLV